MNIVLTNPEGRDVAYLDGFTSFDVEQALHDEPANTFELRMPKALWLKHGKPKTGWSVHIPETPLGGKVLRFTAYEKEVALSGFTWIGAFSKRRARVPTPMEAQWMPGVEVVDGEVRYRGTLTGFGFLLGSSSEGLYTEADLFSVQDEVNGRYRHATAFEMLNVFLLPIKRRAQVVTQEEATGARRLSFEALRDLRGSLLLNADSGVALEFERDELQAFDSIIVAGRGEGANRLIKQYWRNGARLVDYDPNGGMAVDTYFYDYNSLETEEEMRKAAEERMDELKASETVTAHFSALDEELQLGDLLKVADDDLGETHDVQVVRKIVRMNEQGTSFEYEAEKYNGR